MHKGVLHTLTPKLSFPHAFCTYLQAVCNIILVHVDKQFQKLYCPDPNLSDFVTDYNNDTNQIDHLQFHPTTKGPY